MATVGFLYSGSAQSLGAQYNAFLTALPAGTTLNPPNPAGVDNNYLALRGRARALLNSGVAVLVAAGGTVCAQAARDETATQPVGSRTPVVFTSVTDPGRSGLYGDNLTGVAGMTTELDAARLRILKQANPSITRIGVLINKLRPNKDVQWKNLQAAADPRLTLSPGEVSGPGQISQVVRNLVAANVQALLVTADPMFNDKRSDIIRPGGAALTIPAIYQWSEFVTDGGLMSFGPSLVEEYAAAGSYVSRILNGDAVGDIPIYQPFNFELAINASTAMALCLEIPHSLKSRARMVGTHKGAMPLPGPST
jgi:putative ABC transport system substrate-binding protein